MAECVQLHEKATGAMLTIVHDVFETNGSLIHTAACCGVTALGSGNVTSEVAAALMAEGYHPSSQVRIVQADPVLCGPPFEVSGLTLALAAKLDVFCATGPDNQKTPSPLSV